MVMDAQYFGKKLEKEAKYQWELSEYLNRDICQPEGFDCLKERERVMMWHVSIGDLS